MPDLRPFPTLLTLAVVLVLWISAQPVHAQLTAGDRLSTSFSTSVGGSSDTLPFWLYANRYGETDPASQFTAQSLLSGRYRLSSTGHPFLLEIGAGLATRLSDQTNTAHFQTLWLRAEYGIFRIEAGRFHDDAEMMLPGLSSGSMMVSRNATPVPRYMISTPGFIDVPFTSGHLQFRARYGDGVLERDRYVESPLLHQKMAHLKFNFWRFEIMTGFIHNVMWAGTDPERGRLPQSFSDYLRVVFPRPAEAGSASTIPEQTNRLGNAVASYDGSMIVHLNGAELVAYRQIYLEDTVSLRLRSWMDGLYGLGLRNIEFLSWLDTILLEHINTIRQDSQHDFPRGRGNYYNHYAYITGWSYEGNVLGNPLLTFDRNRGISPVINNMVIGWHLGLEGALSDRLSYQMLTTYTRNYGTCRLNLIITGSCFINLEFPPDPNLEFRIRSEVRQDQLSLALRTRYNLLPEYGLALTTTLAADTGEFLGNRVGLEIGLTLSDFHRLSPRK